MTLYVTVVCCLGLSGTQVIHKTANVKLKGLKFQVTNQGISFQLTSMLSRIRGQIEHGDVLKFIKDMISLHF